jgi:hypothetical protein
MKREAARYVSESDTCQNIKAGYMKPGGLLQSLSILEWKWDDIVDDQICQGWKTGLSGLPNWSIRFW